MIFIFYEIQQVIGKSTNRQIDKLANRQIAKSANYFLYLKKSSYLYRNFSTTPPLKEVRELAQRSMCKGGCYKPTN